MSFRIKFESLITFARFIVFIWIFSKTIKYLGNIFVLGFDERILIYFVNFSIQFL